MGNVLKEISPDDPRVKPIIEAMADYKPEDTRQEKYRGKVLAVLSRTGEIIAVADTIDELTAAVRSSIYVGQDWRLHDGPTEEP